MTVDWSWGRAYRGRRREGSAAFPIHLVVVSLLLILSYLLLKLTTDDMNVTTADTACLDLDVDVCW